MAHPNEDLVREAFAASGRGDIDALRNRYFADGIQPAAAVRPGDRTARRLAPWELPPGLLAPGAHSARACT
jgi:ketosteroid isomerase-like protein